MLLRTKDKNSGKTLYSTRTTLISAQDGYIRPGKGKEWFQTTTTVWKVDELIRRGVRDWRRLLGETGHTGSRTGAMRKDHDSVYTGTVSVFPAPLMEWIILRYGGSVGGKILDAFAGGPPRAVVSALMGMDYTGIELRQEQIDENKAVLKQLGLKATYYRVDGTTLTGGAGTFPKEEFDCAITCPPYWNLEVYSEDPKDLSNLATYDLFDHAMLDCAMAHYPLMKAGAFVCIVVGPFRSKKTGELIDFPGDTVRNFQQAGFTYWQQVVLSKNFASAAKRSTNAWRGLKLVPAHEFLLVFRKTE